MSNHQDNPTTTQTIERPNNLTTKPGTQANNPIYNVAHITASVNSPEFFERVVARIDELQDMGLDVEVQYQQSDEYCSALILARRGRSKPGPKPGSSYNRKPKPKHPIKNFVASLTKGIESSSTPNE